MTSANLTSDVFLLFDAQAESSAKAIVPVACELMHPSSVIDVGAGLGTWAAAFVQAGVPNVVALDGPWVPAQHLRMPAKDFVAADLSAPIDLGHKFDLVVCLEVAEHLAEAHSVMLVNNLVKMGDVILFSAAVPWQGGYGHINEKPPEWWEKLFDNVGYVPIWGFGDQFESRKDVAWWYSLNMVFFVKKSYPRLDELRSAIEVVSHPVTPLEAIVPAIMTCAKSGDYVERFIDSYLANVRGLPCPVVVADLTASNRLPWRYLSQLQRLIPRSIQIHPKVHNADAYTSINDASFYVLAKACEELSPREKFILFLEDDVIFSSKIMNYLGKTRLNPNAGFYSLYQPRGEYGSRLIDPHRFYGTQCVLLPEQSAKMLVQNQVEIEKTFDPNYDIRWSRFFARERKRLYASPFSYLQHIGVNSRMGCMGHQSATFVP